MKWIEILRKDDYALLQSESDTQYVVASGYNPDAEENQMWTSGTYFTYWENKTYADDAVEEYNANDLKDVKKCKECGEYFWQTDEERIWFTDRNMKAPCRCYSCRKKKH